MATYLYSESSLVALSFTPLLRHLDVSLSKPSDKCPDSRQPRRSSPIATVRKARRGHILTYVFPAEQKTEGDVSVAELWKRRNEQN